MLTLNVRYGLQFNGITYEAVSRVGAALRALAFRGGTGDWTDADIGRRLTCRQLPYCWLVSSHRRS